MSHYDWRQLWDDLTAHIERRIQAWVGPFTIGGKLDRSTPNAVGRIPTSGGGTGHDQGAEPPLGNPGVSGYVLSSTIAGARSWVPNTVPLALDDLTDVAIAATPAAGDVLTYDAAGGGRWVPAAPTGGGGSAPTYAEPLTWGGEGLFLGGDVLMMGV